MTLFVGFHAGAAETCPEGFVDLSLDKAHWTVVWNGHGKISFDKDGSLYLKPAASLLKTETHSSLVASKEVFGYFAAEITYENIAPTRLNDAPQTWEVLWTFFNFNQDPKTGKKTTNYFLLKPIGAELGKAWNWYDQKFILTANSPQLAYGKKAKLKIEHSVRGFTASLDSGGLFSYSVSAPSDLINDPGKIALYSEDAEVRVLQVCVKALNAN